MKYEGCVKSTVIAGLFFFGIYFVPISLPCAHESEISSSDSHRLADKKNKHKKTKPILEENQLSEEGPRNLIHDHFPIPDSLKPNFEFWKLIYSKYDKNQVIVHDTEHLQIIYSILDFTPIVSENNDDLSNLESETLKKIKIVEEKKRIGNILKKLATGDYQLEDLSVEESRIYHLFDTIDEPGKFEAAAEPGRIRTQRGQKDKFLKAIEWSGAYLTEIEDIFTFYGLPVELTRIIFVESMFNLNARSRAGASGVWQFMPKTGRLFLNVNLVVDERNDPIAATHAAAQLLKFNYEKLGKWPLAINAYNSGTQTLMIATAELGTDDIGVIAKTYRGRAYKFASRNFYAEFLAALEVADHYKNYFGEIQRTPPLRYESFTMEIPVSFVELAEVCGVDLQTLEELNPGYQKIFFSKKQLPSGSVIKIPTGMRAQFEKGVKEIIAERPEIPIKAIAIQ
jgi:membrane-bound lytic murein transglycosylase D